MNYKEALQRPEAQVKEEQINFAYESAQNNLKQGILSIESQMITKKQAVAKTEGELKSAQTALESSKVANPFSTTNVVTSYQNVKQQEENLKAVQTELTNMEELLNYLKALETELFPVAQEAQQA